MSLGTVRAALKDTFATISGVEAYGHVTPNPNVPCTMVGWPEEVTVRPVLGDGTDYRIDVFLYVGWSDDHVADDALMTLVDQAVDAIDDDPNLGGAVMSAVATVVTDFLRTGTDDGRSLLGCRMSVEVMT